MTQLWQWAVPEVCLFTFTVSAGLVRARTKMEGMGARSRSEYGVP